MLANGNEGSLCAFRRDLVGDVEDRVLLGLIDGAIQNGRGAVAQIGRIEGALVVEQGALGLVGTAGIVMRRGPDACVAPRGGVDVRAPTTDELLGPGAISPTEKPMMTSPSSTSPMSTTREIVLPRALCSALATKAPR